MIAALSSSLSSKYKFERQHEDLISRQFSSMVWKNCKLYTFLVVVLACFLGLAVSIAAI